MRMDWANYEASPACWSESNGTAYRRDAEFAEEGLTTRHRGTRGNPAYFLRRLLRAFLGATFFFGAFAATNS